ncbi:Uncharacterised protein [Vibrio cholerae]|nr:Uncharacterised protein [Vibrio cholerae]
MDPEASIQRMNGPFSISTCLLSGRWARTLRRVRDFPCMR